MICGYFNKIYIINLHDRIEKFNILHDTLMSFNFHENDIVRIEAIDTRNKKIRKSGANGCKQSHLLCYETILKENSQYSLIAEDDCIFHPNFKNIFMEYINIIKNIDWYIVSFHNEKPYFRKKNKKFITDIPSLKLINHTKKYGSHFYSINKDLLINTDYMNFIKTQNTIIDRSIHDFKILSYRTNVTLTAQYNLKSDVDY